VKVLSGQVFVFIENTLCDLSAIPALNSQISPDGGNPARGECFHMGGIDMTQWIWIAIFVLGSLVMVEAGEYQDADANYITSIESEGTVGGGPGL
jgi:hypothetical protein